MFHTSIRFIQALHISQWLLYISLCFIFGISAALVVQINNQIIIVVLICSITVIGIIQSVLLRCIAVILLVCSMAYIRVGLLPHYSNPYGEYITFVGQIIREPEIRIDSQRLIIKSDAIEGVVQITRPLQPRYTVGDLLEIQCVLRKPEAFDSFAYDKYLERYGISALCRYPGIEHIGFSHSWRSVLFAAKEYTVQRFIYSIPAPEHSIILGAVFGDKRAVPPHITESFRITGTSHLLVISGMHVSILITIMTRLLQSIRISNRWSVYAIMVLLAVYVTLTGFQASALRASLFGVTALLAELLGRTRSSLRILVMIAAVLLLWQPLLLFYDAGFQLSFLATAGIIIFQKPIEQVIRFIPEWATFRSTAATSLAAMITTTPLIIYSFETLSIIALLANTVVVPLMPSIMCGAIVAIIVSLFFPSSMAMWLNLPLTHILHIFISIVDWFSQLPYASISGVNIHPVVLVFLYLLISIAAYICLQKNK